MSTRFRLKAVAQKSGFSIRRLAKDAKVDYKTLHLLKTGRQKGISFPVLERICRTLKCRPDELFEFTIGKSRASTTDRRLSYKRKNVGGR